MEYVQIVTVITLCSLTLSGAIPREPTPSNALFPRTFFTKNAAGKEVQFPTATRTLLIFLNDSEKVDSPGSLTESALQALHAQAAPILISKNLLANIFTRTISPTFLTATWNKILQKLQSDSDPIDVLKILGQDTTEALHGFVVQGFDLRNWNIWMLPSYENLILLIPSRYIAAKQNEWNQAQKTLFKNDTAKSPATFDLALCLGIALKDFKRIEVASPEAWKALLSNSSSSIQEFEDPHFLSKFFIPNKNYLKTSHFFMPSWVIYLTGHGSKGYVVASIAPKSFKALLSFLNQSILTKLFVYESCYAEGENREIIYGNATKTITQTYSYPIVSVGTVEGPTITFPTDATVAKTLLGTIYLDFKLDFSGFVRRAEKDTPTLYTKLLPTIITGMNLHETNMYGKEVLVETYGPGLAQNYPSIRLQNSTYFLPIIPTVDITKEMVERYLKLNGTKTLDLIKYAQQKTAQILGVSQKQLANSPVSESSVYILKTALIPFAVQVNSAIKIITILHDTPFYLFDTVIVRQASPTSFENPRDAFFATAFLQGTEYGVPKTFLIKNFLISDWAEHIKYEYKNVLIIATKDHNNNTLYYTTQAGEKFMMIKGHKKRESVVEDYLLPYQKDIRALEEEYAREQEKILSFGRLLQDQQALRMQSHLLQELQQKLQLLHLAITAPT